jgi:16S rRNA (uracil1498-N3)-methyltransferase
MQLFFAEDISGQLHTLTESESKHLIRVMRKKVGEGIQLTDGKGNLYNSFIQNANPKKCVLEITSKEFQEKLLKREIHIAIAPTKSNDRLEWFVEKATEIGVSSITPIICDHSERAKLNENRLQKVCISAMKQANRLHLPSIQPLTSYAEFIKSDESDNKLIAHCHQDDKMNLTEIELGGSVSVLIGPEGDFSFNEIEAAIKSDYVSVSLGKSRLRTETAGLTACTLLNSF